MSGILSTILGGVIAIAGVCINAVLTERTAAKREKASHIRESAKLLGERGEELYLVFSDWASLVVRSQMTLPLVMQGHIDYNAHLDEFMTISKQAKVEPSKIEFLVHTYFRELADAHKQVLKRRDTLNKVVNSHKEAYKAGNNSSEFETPFNQALLDFSDEADRFKAELAQNISLKTLSDYN